MHDLASVNNEILPSADANLRAVSDSTLYAKGIFTTVAISGREPFLWEKHWARVQDNCARIGMDLGHDADSVREALDRLIATNDVHEGRARITLFDESAARLWSDGSGQRQTTILITTGDLRPRPAEFKLGISSYPVNSASPLAGVKSCNYLEKIVALDEVRQRGFDEGVQVNERSEITSACMANIFWLKDGKLFTPRLASGCLPGTTREFVLEQLECSETIAGIEALRSADEIFLSSAAIGIVHVAELDGTRLSCRPHPIMELLPHRN